MKFFKPEDFYTSDCRALADTANKLLEDRGLRVYGHETQDQRNIVWALYCEKADTHQAFLVNVEELPKKECVHEVNYSDGYEIKECIHCRIKLRCKGWEPA